MKERTNKLMVEYAITLVIFVVLTWYSSIFPQSFSNGTIDFIFRPENNWTQFAIWVEDGKGEYIGTVFITNFIGRRGGGNRTGDRDIDTPSGSRLSALPIWALKRSVIDTTFGIENYYPPAETQPAYPDEMDAVSGATPNQSIQTKKWQLSGLLHGDYSCWIEVNRSYDFNQYHNYSFYRGQPSLVWNTTIGVRNSADSSMVADYLGYGSTDGSDGGINPPDMTVTTAVNLLSDLGGHKFKVVYTPGSVGIEDDFRGSLHNNYFLLNQNYPNPFNPVTMINYQLPMTNEVNLSIYNLRGQRVATLVNERKRAGHHKVEWDASGYSSGIYYYQLNAGEFQNVKKMILIK
jgi:hypothetical protein